MDATQQDNSEFVVDEEKHLYHLRGRRLWSITDVLGDQGFSDYSGVRDSEFYLLRGKAIHLATLLYDQERLDWSSLVEEVEWKGKKLPWTAGCLRAYERFVKENKLKPLVREQPFYDPIRLYAGRPDWYGESKFGPTVIQIKKGPVEDWVGLQTAAEEQLLRRAGYDASKRRWGVELQPDGTYEVRPFKDHNDLNVFLAALTCAQWKNRNGKERRE